MSSGPWKCDRFNLVAVTFQLTTFWGTFSDELFLYSYQPFWQLFLLDIFGLITTSSWSAFACTSPVDQWQCFSLFCFLSSGYLIVPFVIRKWRVSEGILCVSFSQRSQIYTLIHWLHGLMAYFPRVFISSCSEPKQNCSVELKSELLLLRGLHRFLLPSSTPEICWQTDLLLWTRSLNHGKLLFLFCSVTYQKYVIDVKF